MNGWKVLRLRRPGYLVLILVAVFALIAGTAALAAEDKDDDDACSSGRGPAVKLPATKLFIEHNSTDEDTGVHGLFDGVDWVKLCVFDPRGRLILEVEPKRQLQRQSISGIFFESAEPPNDDVPIEKILARFPEGLYAVRGRSAGGFDPIGSTPTIGWWYYRCHAQRRRRLHHRPHRPEFLWGLPLSRCAARGAAPALLPPR